MTPLATALSRTIEGHLKGPIAGDRSIAVRHLRFVLAHLAAGLTGLALFPLWLALGAPGSGFAAAGFALAMSPLAIAAFVLNTGRLEQGWNLTAACATVFVIWLCLLTGGTASPAVALFAAVPLFARSGPEETRRFALIGALAGLAIASGVSIVGPIDTAGSGVFVGIALGTIAILMASFWPVGHEKRSLSREPDTMIAPPRTPVRSVQERSNEPPGPNAETVRTIDSIVGLASLLGTATAAQEPPAEWQAYARLIRNAGEALQRTVSGKAPVVVPASDEMRRAEDLIAMCWEIADGSDATGDQPLRLWAEPALQLTPRMAARIGPVVIDLFARIRADVQGEVEVSVARDSSGRRIEIAVTTSDAEAAEGAQPFIRPQQPYNRSVTMGDSALRRQVSENGGTLFAERGDNGRTRTVLRLPMIETDETYGQANDGARQSA